MKSTYMRAWMLEVLDMYRLSKTLTEVCWLKSHANRSFFLVFIVTCVKSLNSHM